MLLETSVDEKTGSEFRRRSGAFSGRSRPHLQTFPSDLDGVVCRRNRAMQGDADGKRRSRDDLNLDQLKREELEIKVKYNKFVYPEEQTAAFYAECRSSVGNRSLPWCFGKNLRCVCVCVCVCVCARARACRWVCTLYVVDSRGH